MSYNPREQPTLVSVKGNRFREDTHSTYFNKVRVLFDTLHGSQVDLVWECSHTGRWHLHGWIQFTCIQTFFIEDIHRLMSDGTFEIDTIGEDPGVWERYVYKGSHLWEEWFTRKGWPYNIVTG